MSASDLTCQELVELVTDYFEGVLAEGDVQRFEEHLADCEGCVSYLRQMHTTLRILGRLREDDVPPEVRDYLLGMFRQWKAGH